MSNSETEMTPTPSLLSQTASTDTELYEIRKIRAEMEERFHLYEEIKALPSSDRDALFKILFDAQMGRPEALEAILDLVYDEMPVPMDEFIESSVYLNLKGNIDLEKQELLMLFDQPEVRKMWIAAGSGAGKSFVVSCAMARQIYRVTCLKRPDIFYMLGPNSRIAIINLSVSKEQAKDVIFSEFLARVKDSPWFAGRYRAWSARAKFPKEVYAFSGGSGAIAYYGYHTIMGSLDEVSFMFDRNEKSVAEDLTEAMLKSLSTRFPGAYKLLEISSLRSPEDFLFSQVDRIKAEGNQIQIRRTPGFRDITPPQ
jgi:hypothetical protein